jgi:hypothetical protein
MVRLHDEGFFQPHTGAAAIFWDELDADLMGSAPYYATNAHRRAVEQQMKDGGNANRSFKVEARSGFRDVSDNAIARNRKAAKSDFRTF